MATRCERNNNSRLLQIKRAPREATGRNSRRGGRGSEDLRQALMKDRFGLLQNLTIGLVLSNILKA